VKRFTLGAVVVGLVVSLAPTVLAESDTPDAGVLLDPEIGTAMQALRGRVIAESGDSFELQTTSRQLMVHVPGGFSAPLGACIQVSGQVPLGPVFEAEQASLVPPEDRAAACP
jgi:hypothetical protein